MHIACGGLLWLTAYILAPAEHKVTTGRALGAVFLVTIANVCLTNLLQPLFADLYALVLLVIFIFIVKIVLRLSFWRSVLTAVIYCLGLALAWYLLFVMPSEHNRQPNQSAAANRRPLGSRMVRERFNALLQLSTSPAAVADLGRYTHLRRFYG